MQLRKVQMSGKEENIKECPMCHGIGTIDYEEPNLHQVECFYCKGKGYILEGLESWKSNNKNH